MANFNVIPTLTLSLTITYTYIHICIVSLWIPVKVTSFNYHMVTNFTFIPSTCTLSISWFLNILFLKIVIRLYPDKFDVRYLNLIKIWFIQPQHWRDKYFPETIIWWKKKRKHTTIQNLNSNDLMFINVCLYAKTNLIFRTITHNLFTFNVRSECKAIILKPTFSPWLISFFFFAPRQFILSSHLRNLLFLLSYTIITAKNRRAT